MVRLIRGSPSACLDEALEEFKKSYEMDNLGTCLIVPTQTFARSLRSKLSGEDRPLIKSAVTTLSELVTERLHSCSRAPFVLTPLDSEAVIRQIIISKKDKLPSFFIDGELRQGLIPEVRAFISTTMDFEVDYPCKARSDIVRQVQAIGFDP